MPSFLFQTFRIIYSLNLVAFKDRKPHTEANVFLFLYFYFQKKRRKRKNEKQRKKVNEKEKKRETQLELDWSKFLVLISSILGQVFSSYQPYIGQIWKDCDIRISSKLFHDLSSSLNLFFTPYRTPL